MYFLIKYEKTQEKPKVFDKSLEKPNALSKTPKNPRLDFKKNKILGANPRSGNANSIKYIPVGSLMEIRCVICHWNRINV